VTDLMARKSKNRRNTRRKRYPKKHHTAKRSLRFSKTSRRMAVPLTRHKKVWRVSQPIQRTENQRVTVQIKKTVPQNKNRLKALTKSITPLNIVKEIVCKRRYQRREIIHAVKQSGKGGQKKPNLLTSKIKC